MDDVVMPWAFGDTRMALDHSLSHPPTHLLTYLIWRRCDRQSVKELSKPDDVISVGEIKANKPKSDQRALAAKNGPRIVKRR